MRERLPVFELKPKEGMDGFGENINIGYYWFENIMI